jgi:hypothetical protein
MPNYIFVIFWTGNLEQKSKVNLNNLLLIIFLLLWLLHLSFLFLSLCKTYLFFLRFFVNKSIKDHLFDVKLVLLRPQLLLIASFLAGLENRLCLSWYCYCVWDRVVIEVYVRIIVCSEIIKSDLILLIVLVLHHFLSFLLLMGLFGWKAFLLNVGITI